MSTWLLEDTSKSIGTFHVSRHLVSQAANTESTQIWPVVRKRAERRTKVEKPPSSSSDSNDDPDKDNSSSSSESEASGSPLSGISLSGAPLSRRLNN